MRWISWPFRLAGFMFWFAWQVLASSHGVFRDVFTRPDESNPSIVGYDAASTREWELALLSILISLTPGTLVLGTRSTHEHAPFTLYVHTMYETPDEVRDSVRSLEARMRTALRPGGVA